MSQRYEIEQVNFSTYELTESLQSCILSLTQARDRLLSLGCDPERLDIDIIGYPSYDGDVEVDISVCGYRPCTDEEIEKQLEEELSQAKRIEERERAIYQNLKEKYGDS